MQGNPTQYKILDSTPWILDSKYWIQDSLSLEPWILDSCLSVIPDSLRCILDSKAQDSGFHSKAKFSWNSDPTRRNFLDYRI